MPKVDLSAYEGREQAYIKHCLLEEYLPDWGYKVGSHWDSLVYIDGFAGPWETTSPNYDDSSFGVGCSALKQVADGLRSTRGRQLNVRCILVGKDKAATAKLQTYADSVKCQGFQVETLCGEFIQQLPAIARLAKQRGGSPFKFVFLDPQGWSDIPMQHLKKFSQRPKLRGAHQFDDAAHHSVSRSTRPRAELPRAIWSRRRAPTFASDGE